MSTTIKKIIFFTLWLGLLSLIPLTIVNSTPISSMFVSYSKISNVIQRFLGLTAFVLLFVQIVLGSFMPFWKKMLGDWIMNFHIFEGILVYFVVLLHPIFFALFNHFVGIHGTDPFYLFTDVCVLCSSRLEYFITLGRVSFWLITIAVIAGLFRASTPFLRANWRKFHILNYVVFILIGIHSILLGTDVDTVPFKYFHGPSLFIVGGIIIYKLMVLAKKLPKPAR